MPLSTVPPVGLSTGAPTWDSSGSLTVVLPTGGVGYGTGSGGTVTQLTSKSTTVTLNKPTGQITMNNAALAAGATVGFVLSNSLMSGFDQCLVSMAGGGASVGNYNMWTQPVTNQAVIYVKNISAGSLSEAIVINFAIIKGATS